MKNKKLQKKHIFLIIALTTVSVILATSLILYQRLGGFNSQALPIGMLITLLVLLISIPLLLVIFMIVKKRKVIYWIGASIIGVSIITIACLFFIAGGAFDSRTKLVFSSNSIEKDYDGTPLVGEEWEMLSGELKKGHTAVIMAGEGRTDAGISPNYFTVKICDGSDKDVTEGYNIEYRPGELRVNASAISIKSESATKDYDGTALKNENYQILNGEVLENQELSVRVLGERTDAGVTDNSFIAAVTDENGKDVTHNYNIEKTFGKLVVEKRKITISTPTKIKVYDATALTLKEWKIVSETNILNRHEIKVVISGTQTDVGMSKNSIAEVLITENGKSVSANYAVTYLEGDLIITERKITVRSESDKKNYDGNPLYNHNWDYASQTQILDGHSINVVITGERTEPGESPNVIAEIQVFNAQGVDVSFNYEIKRQEGSLIVVNSTSTEPGNKPGDTDLDESGTIGGGGSGEGSGEGEDSQRVAARVKSEISDSIYLRYMNFGDYTGKKWNPANEYNRLINSKYSMNYLTGIALSSAGNQSAEVSIEVLGNNYLLPYYLDTDELSYKIQTSDVKYSGDTSSIYSAYYYLLNYENSGLNATVPESYKEAEREYFEFVKSQYLSVPASSYDFFREIIDTKGFSVSDLNVVGAIADYIRNAAVYNAGYDDNLDQTDDIAVSFLRDYRQGICQHFATAAAMLYRTLGIPARYVIGYTGNTKTGEWVELTGKNAHAWVEVYLSGIGWVQVEVTAPGYLAGGNGGGGGESSGELSNSLLIKPVDVDAPYKNGIVLLPGNRVQGLSHLIAKGYYYEAVITGRQTAVGIGLSTVSSFTLYDSRGKNVTNKFKIIYGKGKLHVFVREISVTTESLNKIYDGKPLSSTANDAYSLDGELISGHSLKRLSFIGLQTDVGQSENSCDIQIVNEAGDDVTYMYKINNHYGTLKIDARTITITAGSASKKFDGTALTCNQYQISAADGIALAEGDEIAVSFNGTQLEIGKSQNNIDSVIIKNNLGKDVTKNYSVQNIPGWLIVTRL